MRGLFKISVVFIVLLFGATTAFAQPTDADFEAGGLGWSTSQTNGAWMLSFPANGGNPNGYARIMSSFGDSGGTGCVTQTFDCPDGGGGDCLICLDYRHAWIDSSPEQGFVSLTLNGAEYYRTPAENEALWTSVGIRVPPGSHTLSMCLEVLPGNNGWEACFDNVVINGTCDGIIPVEGASWGAIKALYE